MTTTYLFLHGCPGGARDFEPLLERAPRDARCVAIDLPDHGDAPDDPGSDYAATFEALGRAIATCAEPLVLVGHSFGAWLAAFLAPQLERCVERLVLIEGLPGLSQEGAAELGGLGDAIASGAVSIAQTAEIAAARWLPSPPAPELVARVEAMLRSQSRARLGRGLGRMRLLADPDHQVTSIPIPTDVVHLRRDAAVPLAAGEALVARATRGMLHVLEGEGHFPHWTQPDEVARVVFRG